jgi:hypothetical protein
VRRLQRFCAPGLEILYAILELCILKLDILSLSKILLSYSCVLRAFPLSLCQSRGMDVQVKRINNVTILESFLSQETKALPNHFMSNK